MRKGQRLQRARQCRQNGQDFFVKGLRQTHLLRPNSGITMDLNEVSRLSPGSSELGLRLQLNSRVAGDKRLSSLTTRSGRSKIRSRQVTAFGRTLLDGAKASRRTGDLRRIFCDHDQRFGRLDIMVNNAGNPISRIVRPLETTESLYDRIMRNL